MSTEYKVLTKGLNLTRFAGGEGKGCCLHIHKCVNYKTFHSVKLCYNGVLTLKQNLILFLKDVNLFEYSLCEGFTVDKKQVKTLITDLHIYLKDEIHTK